ncbi:MAG TPA: RNA polymerase sigma factor [Verrucomicrobiae bacterium]|jgi:RNA polymerase sigma-70 factor (ECF subfamily)
MTDEQAMWRVAMHDDASAFARLAVRWQPPIQRLCLRMTGDEQLAEDLAQETFARLFTHRKNWVPTARFSTYLWRIALNLCRDELRRARRKFEVPINGESGEPAGPQFSVADPAPDEQLAVAERAALVRDALQRLPEGHRSVVVLKHYEDLKFREIADVLEIPEGTVKSRMAAALEQLNRLLKPALDLDGPQPAALPRTPEGICL